MVSYHLVILENAGLVEKQSNGKFCLTDKGRKLCEVLEEAVKSAERK
ncbi:MAG: winged helix-turn-helix domain-containing protein [Candidatus Micrarchaeia archaeon]